ncbi:MAG: amino acid permease [Ectobacillus sp.]
MRCSTSEEKKLAWWQLSLLGVGCTIGTGYFLGSGIAIKRTGPSVLLAFICAAFTTYIVFHVLATMTVEDPVKGSFRSYAKKAYGHWAGFSSGWVYWCSEMLIVGSQLTALSIFSRFWFPSIPLWMFSVGYAILGLAVIFVGTKMFERIENVLAVAKIAAIFMFIIIAVLALFGVIDGDAPKPDFPNTMGEVLPKGIIGLWSSLIYAFYAFGGIEIMGLMALRLRKPEDAPKSGRIMLLLLGLIYIVSLGLVVTMDSWRAFNTKESPFVIALNDYHLPFIPHIFNGVLIIAGFSTMAASLFAVISILMALAEDGDAPRVFAKKGEKKISIPALVLTASGVAVSIIMALIMPGKIYEYITTAAGLMLLYNWFFILVFSRRLIRIEGGDNVKRIIGMIFIVLAVSGTLLEKSSRPGFFVSLGFVGIIAAVACKMRSRWAEAKQQRKAS